MRIKQDNQEDKTDFERWKDTLTLASDVGTYYFTGMDWPEEKGKFSLQALLDEAFDKGFEAAYYN